MHAKYFTTARLIGSEVMKAERDMDAGINPAGVYQLFIITPNQQDQGRLKAKFGENWQSFIEEDFKLSINTV
jgi:hypothetical protein